MRAALIKLFHSAADGEWDAAEIDRELIQSRLQKDVVSPSGCCSRNSRSKGSTLPFEYSLNTRERFTPLLQRR